MRCFRAITFRALCTRIHGVGCGRCRPDLQEVGLIVSGSLEAEDIRKILTQTIILLHFACWAS